MEACGKDPTPRKNVGVGNDSTARFSRDGGRFVGA
ncbi:hypothetical protein CCACVL1_00725 [Corchorus capsularis]|uniref:Uncharacterized protein n=1 Tax=Corchorus capsularis TaxID=210143 RepID=A0A1R3KVE6_COCAP|nr:hypothetical protein CCACVL1_00725 [Corchorus capsularis]